MRNLTVIIPTYNQKDLLERAINSLISKCNDEINIYVLVNNTESNYIVRNKNYANLHVEYLNTNCGFCKAVNYGLRLIKKSRFIFLLNDDTEVINQIDIDNIIHELIEKGNIFSISLKMLKGNYPNLLDDAGDMYTILGWQFKRGNGLPKELYDRPCEIISACGGAAIYNKKILDEIGYFDEDFFAYLEDVDLGLRALMRGYKNLYYPYISVLHVGSATTGGKYNDITIRLTARNSIYVIYKNLPLPLLIINFPFILLGYLIKFIFFAKKGKGKIYISGVLEGLKNLPKFKEKRRENMRKKKISNIKLEWILIKATFE